MSVSASPLQTLYVNHLETGPVALSPNRNGPSITALSEALASTVDASLCARQAFWNVRPVDMSGLDVLFEDLHRKLNARVDEMAGRMSALGGRSPGTVQAVATATALAPFLDHEADEVEELVLSMKALLRELAVVIDEAIATCERSGDPLTAQYLADAADTVEEHLWAIESHLAPVAA